MKIKSLYLFVVLSLVVACSPTNTPTPESVLETPQVQIVLATETDVPTNTPEPTATETLEPTATSTPTETPTSTPTKTRVPPPTFTKTPVPPTAVPVQQFSWSFSISGDASCYTLQGATPSGSYDAGTYIEWNIWVHDLNCTSVASGDVIDSTSSGETFNIYKNTSVSVVVTRNP